MEGTSLMHNQKISRRKLLQTLLVAGGGVSASAFLPKSWVKPIVNSGVIPAQAALSAPLIRHTASTSIPDGVESQNVPFIDGDLTTDELNGRTQYILSWTGTSPAPGVIGGHQLGARFYYGASYLAYVLWLDGLSSPVSTTDPNIWYASAAPWAGLDFFNLTGSNWDAGVFTVTFI